MKYYIHEVPIDSSTYKPHKLNYENSLINLYKHPEQFGTVSQGFACTSVTFCIVLYKYVCVTCSYVREGGA